jgi:outer membrane protein assembly factor BamB
MIHISFRGHYRCLLPTIDPATRRRFVSRRFSLLVVLCLLFPANTRADWPTHRGNPQRTGNIDGKPGPIKPKLLWHYNCENQFVSSPAIEGKRLYFSALGGFNSGIFYALSTEIKPASRVLWTKNPPYLGKPAVSSPVVADGLLFFGDGMHQTNGAMLYCVKGDTGLPMWKFDLPGELVHMEGAPTVDKGRVYMNAGSGGVFCAEFNRVILEGKEQDIKDTRAILEKRWKELQAKYEADKKKDPDFAVQPTDNDLPQPKPKIVWHKGKTTWHVDAPVAVADSKVLVGTAYLDLEKLGERALICLNAANGDTAWTAKLKYNPWGGPTVAGKMALVGCSTIRLDPDEIKQAKGEVVAVSMDKGDVKWRKEYPGGVVASIAVQNELAIFTATDGKVRAVELASGAPRWTYNAGAPLFAAPAVAGKMVYAADLKGVIHAISLDKGTKEWTFDVANHPDIKAPGAFYGSPIVHEGRIYLATCNLHGANAYRPTVVVCLGDN